MGMFNSAIWKLVMDSTGMQHLRAYDLGVVDLSEQEHIHEPVYLAVIEAVHLSQQAAPNEATPAHVWYLQSDAQVHGSLALNAQDELIIVLLDSYFSD